MRNDLAPIGEAHEWLDSDGLGGFAMGTTSGVRTRRYHGVLCVAARPPVGRVMLVNGLEVHVDGPGGARALSAHRYGDVVHPDGHARVASFRHEPWPAWTYDLGDGVTIEHELFLVDGLPMTVLAWRASAPGLTVRVRPLCSGRDFHALHRENRAFDFETVESGQLRLFAPYPGVPSWLALASGDWRAAPDWWRRFTYAEEQARGLDHVEDLASPGEWTLALDGEAVLVLAADTDEVRERLGLGDARGTVRRLREAERTRRFAFATPLLRWSDAYVVRRGAGRSIVAGYPWFGDWGRDTFIAMRGLLLATGRLREARDILVEWAGLVDQGMLPNHFPDRGERPEYNSVDAALWYVVAADEWLRQSGALVAVHDRGVVERAIAAIVAGYAAGTRDGIRADDDGLLAAGLPGRTQLTWMDARVGGRCVTPRVGKPVEVQALWIRALEVAGRQDAGWMVLADKARAAFAQRFWNDGLGWLNDVVDVDHVPGTVDASLRPNQIFALGGLGEPLVVPARARRALDAVERALVTPLGLRTLAPDDPRYVGRYQGGVDARDGAYHQGTVWPWLMGPFVEAWLRAHGDHHKGAAREIAYGRFASQLILDLGESGIGHVSEIADADPPHTPRGCPFQAWSVGELIRILRLTGQEP